MSYATELIMSEFLRTQCTYAEGQEIREVSITLYPVEDGVNRARASARYWAEIDLSWDVELQDIAIVDARGYVVAWTLADVGKWLAKSLNGDLCIVNIRIADAAKLPTRWTPSRLEKQALKMANLSAEGMRQDAQAKRDTVATWAPGARRSAVLDAAARMVESAAMLDRLNGVTPAPAP